MNISLSHSISFSKRWSALPSCCYDSPYLPSSGLNTKIIPPKSNRIPTERIFTSAWVPIDSVKNLHKLNLSLGFSLRLSARIFMRPILSIHRVNDFGFRGAFNDTPRHMGSHMQTTISSGILLASQASYYIAEMWAFQPSHRIFARKVVGITCVVPLVLASASACIRSVRGESRVHKT